MSSLSLLLFPREILRLLGAVRRDSPSPAPGFPAIFSTVAVDLPPHAVTGIV